ncbi:MAG TPA: metallophosphoesterase family protein [Edaphobacter sp.]|nr:metallophosphoesterase family protein [Edaphobacter sp.]
MRKQFFTSDTHFGHENIIKFCNRPFANVAEMNEAMIERWNAVVGEKDVVYHLGDFACRIKPDEVAEIASRLNGYIYFLTGNHDDETHRAFNRGHLPNFSLLPLYYEAEIEGQKIVMCHYGMRTWHHDLRGTWHLYGHSHAGLPPLGKSCDVGVDAWDFTPIEFSALKAFMDARSIHKAPAFKDYTPAEK